MKIKKDFILREIGNDFVLVPIGKAMGEFTGLFPVTEVGARIWKLLIEEKSQEEIVEILFDEYEAEKSVLKSDVSEFLGELKKYGIIE